MSYRRMRYCRSLRATGQRPEQPLQEVAQQQMSAEPERLRGERMPWERLERGTVRPPTSFLPACWLSTSRHSQWTDPLPGPDVRSPWPAPGRGVLQYVLPDSVEQKLAAWPLAVTNSILYWRQTNRRLPRRQVRTTPQRRLQRSPDRLMFLDLWAGSVAVRMFAPNCTPLKNLRALYSTD